MFAYLNVKTQQLSSWSGGFRRLQELGLIVDTEDALQAFVGSLREKGK
jgi:hypothetical protein